MVKKEWPKISIVTPNYNQSKYLEDTILSVINQGYPNLEYIIIDGGSTDNSIEIIKKYEKYLTYWVSEPDDGMYHAIQKGFNICTGEIMAWINSDDMYHNKAFFAIAEIFTTFPQVDWIMGRPSNFDEIGRIIAVGDIYRFRFSRLKVLTMNYKVIQQESTFWRRKLWEISGSTLLNGFTYAGDFGLWLKFFRYSKLYLTTTLIGGFRKSNSEQISSKYYNKYHEECRNSIKAEIQTQSHTMKLKIVLVKFLAYITSKFYNRNVILLRKLHIYLMGFPQIITYVNGKYLMVKE